MAAELWVNDGGVARQIREVWVNDAGTARQIREIWVNDSGTARKVYASELISIDGLTVNASSSGTTSAVYVLGNDGNIRYTTDGTNTVEDHGDWITPQTNMANYEVFASVTSGTLTGGTTGAWQSLGTTRTWNVTRPAVSGFGTSSATIALQIRRASDGVVVDTASIDLRAAIA